MMQRYMVGVMGVCLCILFSTQAKANVPAWENWQPVFEPQPYAQPQQPRQEFLPARQGSIPYQLQQAAYMPTPSTSQTVNCGLSETLNLPSLCLRRTNYTREGLEILSDFLQQKSPWEQAAPLGNNVSNKALMETTQVLLNWHNGRSNQSFNEQFDLIPINSAKGTGKGNFTGYYTPTLQGSRVPTSRFRIPIYGKPKFTVNHLTNGDILNGALSGRGLEIAWVDDAFALSVAQVQGAAVIQFQDGRQSVLAYAGNNNHRFSAVSQYLLARGYMSGSLNNERIAQWLRANPQKVREVLSSNERYIFFKETKNPPATALGHSVIPGHTVAVDSRYIPHGAVLLAELPRVTVDGEPAGNEWRLLFAQDNGKAIQGNGRIDLYTGSGRIAEKAAYVISGARRTFMLVRKADNPWFAGL